MAFSLRVIKKWSTYKLNMQSLHMFFFRYSEKPLLFLFDVFGINTIIGLFIIMYLHIDYTYFIHYYPIFLLSSLFIFKELLVYKKKENNFFFTYF